MANYAEYTVKDIYIGILQQAVNDWRELMRREKYLHEHPDEAVGSRAFHSSFDELREFFLSDYGSGMCETVNLDSETVLAKLESDLAESRKAYA